MDAASKHRPVLRDEVVAAFRPVAPRCLADATVGLGGHARALLEAFPDLVLVGLDVDPFALEMARTHLAPFASRVRLVHASYWDLPQVVAAAGLAPLGGVLFDLGVSSLQLDTPARGFSFRFDGPLDMRFSGRGMTAAELVATVDEDELARILFEYGEEPRARRVARAIVATREREPLRTTGQLRQVVARALARGFRGRTDPVTRTFQALRIATNRELEGLPPALEQAARLLEPGGRLAAISFHSLEDRLVKRTLKHLSGACVCPPGTRLCACDPQPLLDIVTRRPIRPRAAEVADNPRARSAGLRVAQRRRA